jgi:hypothetical protein
MVVTLLQLLLANFTPNTIPSFKELDGDTGPDTAEDIEIIMVDTNREKEIVGKTITGVLLLMLKWFRSSRIRPLQIESFQVVLQFEFLSQLLYDSNYHILAAKLLTLDIQTLAIPTVNEMSSQTYKDLISPRLFPSLSPS